MSRHAVGRTVGLIAVTVFLILPTIAFASYSEGITQGTTPGLFGTTITVDGSLADWAPAWVAQNLSAAKDRANSLWIPTIGGVNYWIEDGVSSSGVVGPGTGDQAFDIEAMYAAANLTNIYAAIVTGTDQNGESVSGTTYYPGDIFFDTNLDGSWDIAVVTRSHDSYLAGTVYAPAPGYATSWWTTTSQYSSSSPSRVKSGRAVALYSLGSSFVYTNATNYDSTYKQYDHNVIELSLSRETLLSFGVEFDLTGQFHFTQTCGNDVATLTFPVPPIPPDEPPPVIPEPTTLTLGLAGMGVLGLLRRRRAAR